MNASDAWPHPSRRQILSFAGATFAAATIPRWASAAGTRDPRLVVVVLRGALDGLSAVAPIGDPGYADLHGALALRWDGPHPALRLERFLRPQSGDGQFRPAVRRQAGAGGPCDGDKLS